MSDLDESKNRILKMKPSEIYFCQDTVTQYFNRTCVHPFKPIGETLDALCNGEIDISTIPNIVVLKRDGKWFTENNRRLWLFKKLELVGLVEMIDVIEVPEIPDHKWTTVNGGVSVEMIGIPGGIWWRKIAKMFPDVIIESKILPPDFTVMPEDASVIPQSLNQLQSLGNDISYLDDEIDNQLNSTCNINSNVENS